MPGTIGTAYIQIEPTTQGIGTNLTKTLNGELGSVGSNAGKSFGNAFGAAAKIGAAGLTALGASAVATGVALTNGAIATAEYGDSVDKMSQKLGVSSGFYQEWDAVLKHSGTSMDSMGATFKRLATAVQDGSDDQKRAFDQLGLSMEDLQTMSTEDVFTSVIGKLQEMEEGTERTALATELLGRGAQELGPLLNTSAEDTQAMIDTVNELGGVMSEDGVKNAAAMQDALQDMHTAFAGVKNAAMSELLPSFTSIVSGLAGLVTGSADASDQLKEGVGGIIDSLSSALPNIVSSMSDVVVSVAEIAPELIMTLADGILENLPMIIESGAQVIIELATGIGQALPTLIPEIVNVLVTITMYLLENIDLLIDAAFQLMGGLAIGIVNAIPVIVSKLPAVISGIINGIAYYYAKLLEVGKTLMTKMGEGISSAVATVRAKAVEIINNMVSAIREKIDQFVGIGKDIIAGIKNGISDAWSNLTGWIGEKCAELVDSVKNALKIGSPSRVMAEEVGRWIPAGVAEGITGGMGVLNDAVDDMTTNATMQASMIAGSATYESYNSGVVSNDSSVEELLRQYLPQIAKGGNVTVNLEGDARQMFNVIKKHNSDYIRSTGRSAFA